MKLKTTPYQHQLAAIAKQIRSKVGALFMEMGTGKTRVALGLGARRQDRISNIIWYCPVSLKETIAKEVEKHTDCKAYIFDHRTDSRNVPLDRFIYIIGLESMSSSARVIFAARRVTNARSFVVVDESDMIKGHRSERAKWITNISEKSLYRLIMTGTPISQGIVDLYAQMRFLSPKILGYNSFYSFAHNHLEYSEKYPGMIVRSHNEEYIAAKIKPYVYQVTKEECLDLPKKIYKTYYFRMTAEQREHYEMAKEEILFDIDYNEFDSVTIFRLFTVLQQITCGFWHRIRDKTNDFIEINHNRVDTLMDAIERIPAEEKIIIWCKFEYDINQISKAIRNEYGDCYSLFYGKLSDKKRNTEIEAFRTRNRFLMATASCGGRGLTLNEAAYVINYNASFKYSERLQAEDRCHRIGQNRKVTYIDIVCTDSIDERIMGALASKGSVVDAFKKEVEKIKSHNSLRELVSKL